MSDTVQLNAILDSMKHPVVFVDTSHSIRYMNKSAILHYARDGGEKLIGTSIFDCHNEQSQRMIREIYDEMVGGLEERLITDNEKHRIYMRAVRDGRGTLLGYYERYEPPAR